MKFKHKLRNKLIKSLFWLEKMEKRKKRELFALLVGVAQGLVL